MNSVAMDITETMDLVMVSETTVMNMIMTVLVVIIMVMDIMDHTEEVMIVGGNMVQSIKVIVSKIEMKNKTIIIQISLLIYLFIIFHINVEQTSITKTSMVESHMDMEVIPNMEKVAYSLLPHILILGISGHHLVHMMMIMITMIQSAIG